MKILIIRFSAIGDIVLTSPIFRCIKAQIPNAELHWLTKQKYQDVLKYNPYITKTIVLSPNLSLPFLINALKNEGYDYIIDLQGNLRSRLIRLTLNIQSEVFDKLNLRKYLYVRLKINVMPTNLHIVDRYFATATKLLGIIDDGIGLDYIFPKNTALAALPVLPSTPFIALVLGATYFTKKLPIDKLVDLAKSLNNYTIVLLGGPAEIPQSSHLLATLPLQKIISYCGITTLDQSALILSKAVAVITHDTGLMHIAAALKKPTIVVWGNTTPLLGMYPYKTKYLNLEVLNLPCRPCSKIGFNHCPKDHFSCMRSQNFGSINTWLQLNA